MIVPQEYLGLVLFLWIVGGAAIGMGLMSTVAPSRRRP